MKASVLAVCVLCAAGAAIGQTPPASGQHDGTRQLDHLVTLLDLTDAQKPQVKSVLDAEHAKMKAQFDQAHASGTRPTFDQMRALHEQLKAETIQQLTPVLTPAQLKKFAALEEEHGPRGGPHGRPGADAPANSAN
ncbi:MAG: hypothetical protein JWN85_110 [Gammaproteobacteria bacterium]|nr:hypothetical protein [Gammaproteobacteria bacterium]